MHFCFVPVHYSRFLLKAVENVNVNLRGVTAMWFTAWLAYFPLQKILIEKLGFCGIEFDKNLAALIR